MYLITPKSTLSRALEIKKVGPIFSFSPTKTANLDFRTLQNSLTFTLRHDLK